MAKSKKYLLTLDQRDATLGTNISTNSELHGDERIPRKDIPLSTLIDRKELCSLLREPTAADALFATNGKAHEPLFAGKIGALPVTGKFEDCSLQIFTGIDLLEIAMHDVVLSTIRLLPQVGGWTQMKFTAQFHSAESPNVGELDHWLGQEVKIALTIGKVKAIDEKQPDLPLDNVDRVINETQPEMH